MDYEKAYKESFEAAKGLHDAGNALTKKQMEIVFPQLAESEDERIRKWILEYLHDGLRKADEQFKEQFGVSIAWLEKQKEQKPVQSDVEREYVRTLKSLISDFLRGKEDVDREYYQQVFDWLDGRHIEQKPAEWNEEDENYLGVIVRLVEQVSGWPERAITEYTNWLKSLRPSWKPSEEQMEALLKVVDKARELHYTSIDGYDGYNELRSLYEQIKKLM